MTQRVLIGVDGSRRSADAIAVGMLLAPLLGAEPTFVHAHPYGELETLLSDSDYAQIVREVVRAAEREAPSKDLEPTSPRMLLIGDRSPAAALHAAARSDDVVALVVGSSHRGRLGRVLPGSTARRLLSGAPCPVVVAPGGHAARQPLALGPIGVGFDGSPEASSALALAERLARANAGPLAVLAVHKRIAFGGLPVTSEGILTTADRALRAELAARVDRAVDALAMGDQATAMLHEGDPATVLARESKRLGLLVVGSRGYGPLNAVLLGSVATRLLETAACPVMVIPRSAASGTAA